MTRVLATGFTMPRAIAVADGSIFVADTEQGTVVRVQDGVRSTVAEIDSNKAEIERFVNGQLSESQLRSVRYLEFVWKAPDGTIMVTSRRRFPDGSLGPTTTRIL